MEATGVPEAFKGFPLGTKAIGLPEGGIIVTHNKQTMASVDVIYGVTMQEAGVSKLVPVDFRSLN